nr:hypothetical protein CFP56_78690 [Quercus suber]
MPPRRSFTQPDGQPTSDRYPRDEKDVFAFLQPLCIYEDSRVWGQNMDLKSGLLVLIMRSVSTGWREQTRRRRDRRQRASHLWPRMAPVQSIDDAKASKAVWPTCFALSRRVRKGWARAMDWRDADPESETGYMQRVAGPMFRKSRAPRSRDSMVSDQGMWGRRGCCTIYAL